MVPKIFPGASHPDHRSLPSPHFSVAGAATDQNQITNLYDGEITSKLNRCRNYLLHSSIHKRVCLDTKSRNLHKISDNSVKLFLSEKSYDPHLNGAKVGLATSLSLLLVRNSPENEKTREGCSKSKQKLDLVANLSLMQCKEAIAKKNDRKLAFPTTSSKG